MKQFTFGSLIALLLLLTACGSINSTSQTGNLGLFNASESYMSCPSGAATSASEPESGPVTLTVNTSGNSDTENKLLLNQIAIFEQQHPAIKVKWQPLPDQYEAKIHTNIQQGNAADIFLLEPQMANDYLPNNNLLNLSPYMARDHVNASDYYSNIMNLFSCKDGQVYGLPKDWGTLGIFYNKAMFKAAHVAVPSPDWTWGTFQEIAKQLTKHGDATTAQYGITLNPDPDRWYPFLLANDGHVLTNDGNKAAFNSQQGIDALNFYAGLTQAGVSVPPSAVGASWSGEAFGKQRAAMAMEGGWLVPYMSMNFPKVDYGILPLPKAPNGKRGDLIFTNAWSAYAGTKHPEAAWEFIKFMTGLQAQQMVLSSGFALPTLVSLQNDPYLSTNPIASTLLDAANYSYADNFGPHDANIRSIVAQALANTQQGKSDAKTALDQAAATVNKELRR